VGLLTSRCIDSPGVWLCDVLRGGFRPHVGSICLAFGFSILRGVFRPHVGSISPSFGFSAFSGVNRHAFGVSTSRRVDPPRVWPLNPGIRPIPIPGFDLHPGVRSRQLGFDSHVRIRTHVVGLELPPSRSNERRQVVRSKPPPLAITHTVKAPAAASALAGVHVTGKEQGQRWRLGAGRRLGR
jgi:hypothetical protein